MQIIIDSEEVSPRSGAALSEQKTHLNFISNYIDSLSATLRPISLKIHDNPELNFKEFIAHKTLTDFLETRKGWKVTPSACGIATAFIAEYDSGKEGPVISHNAEYGKIPTLRRTMMLNQTLDALPGIGHACGHNLIATAALAAALASAAAMENYSLPGKVVLFGTPAEEGGGGKIKLLDASAYSDHKVDINLISHPGNTPDACLVRTNAYQGFKVQYFGKEAHAAQAPWDGINALDALIIAYNALSVLRQQTMPGDIIQGCITNGGSRPNIIHAYSAGRFAVRATSKARLAVLKKKVFKCFEAGAEATGARLDIEEAIGYDDHVPNWTLGKVCREAMNSLECEIPEQEMDYIRGATQASTDQGNVSYAMPSLSLGFQIESKEGPHNPKFAEAARTMEAHEKALRAGKALAVTGVMCLTDDSLLKEAKKEFNEMKKKEGEAVA